MLIATPIDLRHVITIDKPATRAMYELEEHDRAVLPRAIAEARGGKKGGEPWLRPAISRSRTWTRRRRWRSSNGPARLKREVKQGTPHPLLAGRTLAMIFQKPSLRTRVSFEVGMTQLGGHAIYLGPSDIKLGERETVEDIALTISRMCDVIMARVFGHDIVADLAQHATVPVINALSDREHPCQILADLQTIQERKGRFEGLKAVFVGDGNNVAQSLPLRRRAAGDERDRGLPGGLRAGRRHRGRRGRDREGDGRRDRGLERPAGGRAAAPTCSTRTSGPAWARRPRRRSASPRSSGFQIDAGLMAAAKPDAIVLHCLPAHYGEEIDYAVSRTPNSAIFDQAENRLHAQKALMAHLMGV